MMHTRLRARAFFWRLDMNDCVIASRVENTTQKVRHNCVHMHLLTMRTHSRARQHFTAHFLAHFNVDVRARLP